MNKSYIVTYRSRYYPMEGDRRRRLSAPSKVYIRNNWHDYIGTDEYRIVKIEEEK
ncbi:MAG: hypothetical protein PHN80_05985 [Hespellia sp.]|nr:hypothetical protein [Hespellia sp.]